MKLNDAMFTEICDATQLLRTSGPMAATAAIQRALNGDAMPASEPGWNAAMPHEAMHDINPAPASRVDAGAGLKPASDILARFRKSVQEKSAIQPAMPTPKVKADIVGKGKYLAGSITNQAGTRGYKLYVPSAYTGQPLPLIVMLHGCKQNPDDFAAGTGMNGLAEEYNCFVVYPAQTQNANGSNCWNWFNAAEQQRDRGEPSIIADITREIIRTYHIDTRRVYVAGLSAGGAMAAILGATYPDLYAAVGIHSGLPHGAAHDLPSAFAAMKNGNANGGPLRRRQRVSGADGKAIPVIVFHGDRDATVHPCNGDYAMAQCLSGDGSPRSGPQVNAETEQGHGPQGRAYTRTIRRNESGAIIAEHWLVHGAGHAWSGGNSSGSYTDPKGPNATREMLRFFNMHAHAIR